MRRCHSVGLVCVFFVAIEAGAADWPQFRYDANRGAASPQQLAEKLHANWSRQLPAPRPAFPNELRLNYDASYEPIVLGQTMFIPSSVDDSVTAISTRTGDLKWKFVTDGPVRFAPAGWEGKVCFTSDDGFLYCVNADDGKLVWKHRGLPADRKDRKVFGNDRLISLWPARGGPVMRDGVVYFAAGIWPDSHIFVHALDAKSGEVKWSNVDSHHIPQANMDHAVKAHAGLTPQGYLAIVNDRLVIPCGAQLPAFLELKTGKLGPYTMGWGGRDGLPKGTWFLAGTKNYLINSGDLCDIDQSAIKKDGNAMLMAGGWSRVETDPTNRKFLGQFRRPVMTETAMYYTAPPEGRAPNAKPASIRAYDLTKPPSKVEPHKRKDKRSPILAMHKVRFPELWRIESDLKVHIKAGNRLYAGAGNRIAAIGIPEENGEAKISWQATIEGNVHTMIAADDRLFVVTKEGSIFTFAAHQANHSLKKALPVAEIESKDDKWTSLAKRELKESGASEGYALVLGVGSGRLADELLAQSKLHVIAIDPDARKIARLRERMQKAGVYGSRFAAHVGDPLSVPLPPYMASLVVSEDTSVLGETSSSVAVRSLFHMLRPYGGTVCLLGQDESFVQTVQKAKLAKASTRLAGDLVLLTRDGALPGADDWSHKSANAGNAGASQDYFLKAPLGMLWFNSALRWQRKPGQTVLRVAGGRVYVLAEELFAMDAYTGRLMWKAKMPAKAPSRIRTRSEVVCMDDAVYMTDTNTCLVFNAATGESMKPVDIADYGYPNSSKWTAVRIWKNQFVGLSGKRLVCIDRKSRKLLWSHDSSRKQMYMAVGNGKVYCAEVSNTVPQKSKPVSKEVPANGSRTVAFDIEDGTIRWEIEGASAMRYSEPKDLLMTKAGLFFGKDGTQLRAPTAVTAPIAGDRIIKEGKGSYVLYDLVSGKQYGKEHAWNRRGCTNLRAAPHLATTRFNANAAFIDLKTREISRLWNVRSGCANNLLPANGLLSAPNVTGGCTCNYSPTSMAWAPLSVIERDADD